MSGTTQEVQYAIRINEITHRMRSTARQWLVITQL